ncbi:MAG TPA: serpin family protein [Haliangiales bacterium]|nr:serpin family protein [Haliangiales bacterium]
MNRFAFSFYGKLPARGNIIYSPASIELALAMAQAGALGETAAEIGKALGAGPDAIGGILASLRDAKEIELAIADRLWGDRTLRLLPPYQTLTREKYGAELGVLDFRGGADRARDTINKWVEEQTKGKIKDLLPPGAVDRATRLVLTNAIYFKGTWESPFDKGETHDAPFHAPGGEKRAPLMHASMSLAYGRYDGYQVVSLPYRGGRLVMDVILPDGNKDLPALEKRLVGDKPPELATRELVKVSLFLPRFTVRAETTLKKPLGALGVRRAFADDAQFGGIAADAEKEGLHISEGYHQAFIEVNEEGTEAAAATGMVMRPTMARLPEREVTFRADHPFLYAIRDATTGLILFMGRYETP